MCHRQTTRLHITGRWVSARIQCLSEMNWIGDKERFVFQLETVVDYHHTIGRPFMQVLNWSQSLRVNQGRTRSVRRHVRLQKILSAREKYAG
jgi:hypothetical protein